MATVVDSVRLSGAVACAALALYLAGCASEPQIGAAIGDVNKSFRADYEAVLAKKGTRRYPVSRAEAYDAVRVTMARLGMMVEAQDPVLGFVNVYAPAPRPLDLDEWRQAAELDLPRMREIIRPHIGLLSHFVRFEPEGLQVVISGTVVEVPSATEISFTVRMRELAPPKSGIPRREYVPPSAVSMGLDKIWAGLEQEFKATVRRP